MMLSSISADIDPTDKKSRKLGAALIKAVNKRCASLFKSGVDATFQNKWKKAIEKAKRKNITYAGSSMSEIQEIIDDLVTDVRSALE